MNKLTKSILAVLLIFTCAFGVSACQNEDQVVAVETQFIHESMEIELKREYDIFDYLDKELTDAQKSYLKFKVDKTNVAYVTPTFKLIGVDYGTAVVSAYFGEQLLDTMGIEIIQYKTQLQNPVNLKYDFSTKLVTWNYSYCEIDGEVFTIPQYEIEYIKNDGTPVIDQVINNNTYRFEDIGNYKIRVRTISPSANYVSSEFAKDANGNPEYFEINLMASPNNLAYDDKNNILSWNANGNPDDTEYIVHYKFNGSTERTKRVEITSCVFGESLEYGEHTAYIEVVQHKNYYANASDTITLTKLKTPTINFNNGNITWDSIKGAVSYKYTLTYNGGADTYTTIYTNTSLAKSLPSGECSIAIEAISDDSPTTYNSKIAYKGFVKLSKPEIRYDSSTNTLSIANTLQNNVMHEYSLKVIKTTDRTSQGSINAPFDFTTITNYAPYGVSAQLYAYDSENEIDSDFATVFKVNGMGSYLSYIQNLQAPELSYAEVDDGTSLTALISFTEIDKDSVYSLALNNEDLSLTPESNEIVISDEETQTEFTFNIGEVKSIFTTATDYDFEMSIVKSTQDTYYNATTTQLRVTKLITPEKIGLINELVVLKDDQTPVGVSTNQIKINNVISSVLNMQDDELNPVSTWNIEARYIATTFASMLEVKTYYTSSDFNTFTIKRLNAPTSLKFNYETKTLSYGAVVSENAVSYNIYRNGEYIGNTASNEFGNNIVGRYLLTVEAVPAFWESVDNSQIGYYKSLTNSINVLQTNNIQELWLTKTAENIVTAHWTVPDNSETSVSNSDLLYRVYVNGEVKQDKLSTDTDTGSFTFPSNTSGTIKVALYTNRTGADKQFFDTAVIDNSEQEMGLSVELEILSAPTALSRSGDIFEVVGYLAEKMQGTYFNETFYPNQAIYNDFSIAEGETKEIRVFFGGIFSREQSKYYISSSTSTFTVKKLNAVSNLDFRKRVIDNAINYSFSWDSPDLLAATQMLSSSAEFSYSTTELGFYGSVSSPTVSFNNIDNNSPFEFFVQTVASDAYWTQISSGETKYLSSDTVLTYSVVQDNAVTDMRLDYDLSADTITLTWNYEPVSPILTPKYPYTPYFIIDVIDANYQVVGEQLFVKYTDCYDEDNENYTINFTLSDFNKDVSVNTTFTFSITVFSEKTITSETKSVTLTKLAPVTSLFLSNDKATIVDDFNDEIQVGDLIGVESIVWEGDIEQDSLDTFASTASFESGVEKSFTIHYKAIAPEDITDGNYYLSSEAKGFRVQRVKSCDIEYIEKADEIITPVEQLLWNPQAYADGSIVPSFQLMFIQEYYEYTLSLTTNSISINDNEILTLLKGQSGYFNVYGRAVVFDMKIGIYNGSAASCGYISGIYDGESSQIYKLETVGNVSLKVTDPTDVMQKDVTITWTTVDKAQKYYVYITTSEADFMNLGDLNAILTPIYCCDQPSPDEDVPEENPEETPQNSQEENTEEGTEETPGENPEDNPEDNPDVYEAIELSFDFPTEIFGYAGCYYVTIQAIADDTVVGDVAPTNTVVRLQTIDNNDFYMEPSCILKWIDSNQSSSLNLDFQTYKVEIWNQEVVIVEDEDGEDEQDEENPTNPQPVNAGEEEQGTGTEGEGTEGQGTEGEGTEGEGTGTEGEEEQEDGPKQETKLVLKYTFGTDDPLKDSFLDLSSGDVFTEFINTLDGQSFVAKIMIIGSGQSNNNIITLSSLETSIDIYRLLAPTITVLKNKLVITSEDVNNASLAVQYYYTISSNETVGSNSYLVNNKLYKNKEQYEFEITNSATEYYITAYATTSMLNVITSTSTDSTQTRLAEPQDFRINIDDASDVEQKNVQISWEPVEGATSYDVYVVYNYEETGYLTKQLIHTCTVAADTNPDLNLAPRYADDEGGGITIDPEDPIIPGGEGTDEPTPEEPSNRVVDVISYFSANREYDVIVFANCDEIATSKASNMVKVIRLDPIVDGYMTADRVVHFTTTGQEVSDNNYLFEMYQIGNEAGAGGTKMGDTVAIQLGNENSFDGEGNKLLDSEGNSISNYYFSGFVNSEEIDNLEGGNFAVKIRNVGNGGLADTQNGIVTLSSSLMGSATGGIVVLKLYTPKIKADVDKLIFDIENADVSTPNNLSVKSSSHNIFSVKTGHMEDQIIEPEVEPEEEGGNPEDPDNPQQTNAGDEGQGTDGTGTGTDDGTGGGTGTDEEEPDEPEPPKIKRVTVYTDYAQGSEKESYMLLKDILPKALNDSQSQSFYEYPENWLPGDYQVILQTQPNEGVANVLQSNIAYKHLYRLKTPDDIVFQRAELTDPSNYSSDPGLDSELSSSDYISPLVYLKFNNVPDAISYMIESGDISVQALDSDVDAEERDQFCTVAIKDGSDIQNLLYKGSYDAVHSIFVYAYASGDNSPVTNESEAFDENIDKFAISSPRAEIKYTFNNEVQDFRAVDGYTHWTTQYNSAGYIIRALWNDLKAEDIDDYVYWETLNPTLEKSLLTGIVNSLNNNAGYVYPDGYEFTLSINSIGNVTTEGVSATNGTAILDSLFLKLLETYIKIPQVTNMTTNAGYIAFDRSFADTYVCEVFDAETHELVFTDDLLDFSEVLGVGSKFIAYTDKIHSQLLPNKLYYMVIQAQARSMNETLHSYNVLYADKSERLYFKVLENVNKDATDISLFTPIYHDENRNLDYKDLDSKEVAAYVSANSNGLLQLVNTSGTDLIEKYTITSLIHEATKYSEKTQVHFPYPVNFDNAAKYFTVMLASMGSTNDSECGHDSEIGVDYYYLSSSFTTSQEFYILGGTTVVVEDGIIKWSTIEQADGYYVYINGNSAPFSSTLIHQSYIDLPPNEGGENNTIESIKHIDVVPVSLSNTTLQGPVKRYDITQYYSNQKISRYIDLIKLHTPDLFDVVDGSLIWTKGVDGLDSFDAETFATLCTNLQNELTLENIDALDEYVEKVLNGPVTFYSKYTGLQDVTLSIKMKNMDDNNEISFYIDGLTFLKITDPQYQKLLSILLQVQQLCETLMNNLIETYPIIQITPEKYIYKAMEQYYNSYEELMYARLLNLKDHVSLSDYAISVYNKILRTKGFPSSVTLFEELCTETSNLTYGNYTITVQQLGNNFEFLNSSYIENSQQLYIPNAPTKLTIFMDDDNDFYLSWDAVDIGDYKNSYSAKLDDSTVVEDVVYILYGEDFDGKRYELARTIGDSTATDNKLKICLTDLIEKDYNDLWPELTNIYLVVAGSANSDSSASVKIINGIRSEKITIDVLAQLEPTFEFGTLILSNISSFGYQIKALVDNEERFNINQNETENTWLGDELLDHVTYTIKVRSVGKIYQGQDGFDVYVLTGRSYSFKATKLDTQNVYVNKYGVFEWDKVTNATGFMVTVNDEEYPHYVCTDINNSMSYESDYIGYNNYKFRALGSNGAIVENSAESYYFKSHINNNGIGLNAAMLSQIGDIKIVDGLIQFSSLDASNNQNRSIDQNGLTKYIGYKLTFDNGGGTFYSTSLPAAICAKVENKNDMFFDFTNYGHEGRYKVTIQPYIYFANNIQQIVGQTRYLSTDYYQLLGKGLSYEFTKNQPPINIKVVNGEFVWDGTIGDLYYINVYDSSGALITSAISSTNSWWPDETSQLNSQDYYTISIKEYRKETEETVGTVFSVFTKYANINGEDYYCQKLAVNNYNPGNANDDNGNYITFVLATQGSAVGFNIMYRINDETEYSTLLVSDPQYRDVVSIISNQVRINVNRLSDDIIYMDYKLQLVTLNESFYLKSNWSDVFIYSTPNPVEDVYFDEENLEYYFEHVGDQYGYIIKDELLINQTDTDAYVTYFYKIMKGNLTTKNYYKVREINGQNVGTISYLVTADGYFHRVSVSVSVNPNSVTSNISPYITSERIFEYTEFTTGINIFDASSIVFTDAEVSDVKNYITNYSYGSANNPYRISSLTDFENLNRRLYFYDYLKNYTVSFNYLVGEYIVLRTIDINTDITSYEFKLTSDILDITTPLGKTEIQNNVLNFVGFGNTLNGDGHNVAYNIKLNSNSRNYYRYGLFMQLETTGVIKNLIVEAIMDFDGRADSTITFGSVVGYNKGTVSNIKVNSISVSNLMKNNSGPTTINFGGVVGENDGGIINNVVVKSANKINLTSTISTATMYVGGITSKNTNGGQISQCGNEISYEISSVQYAYVGGIVGFNNGAISQSYNKASIIATCSSNSATTYIGGLVASNSTNGSISTSYVSNISISSFSKSSTNIYAGGLVGYSVNRNINLSLSQAETIILKTDTSGNPTAYGGTLFGVVQGNANSNVNYYINEYAVSDKNNKGDFTTRVDLSSITLTNQFVDNLNTKCGAIVFDVKDNKVILIWEKA